MRGLIIRIGAIGGLILGFSQGVIRPVAKAMNCSAEGNCQPEERTVALADFLLPMGLGLLGGLALGLLVASLVMRVVDAR